MLSLFVLIAAQDTALIIADFKCGPAARRTLSLLSLTAFLFCLTGVLSVFSFLILPGLVLSVSFLMLILVDVFG